MILSYSKYAIRLLVLGLAILFAIPLSASPFKTPFERLKSKKSQISINYHGLNLNQKASGLGLVGGSFKTVDQMLGDAIQNHIVGTNIRVFERTEKSGLNLTTTNGRRTFGFAVAGVPFCSSGLVAQQVKGQPIMLGRIPTVESGHLQSIDQWPSIDRIHELILDDLGSRDLDSDDATFVSERPCAFISGDRAEAVREVFVQVGSLTYAYFASDSKIYDFYRRAFDVYGKAKVYESNPYDGNIAEYKLGNLTGDGTLTSDLFVTDPIGEDRAYNSNHEFIFDPGSSGFDEASVFVHVNETFEWFSALGYNYTSEKKFKLKVHAVINGDVNNALYTPETSSTGPTILVGDGDGVWLQNLPKDGDVASHEFGHHVIFQTLKEVRGESLVIHEGLADFFTFSRTGDPCLGESICPINSPIKCQVKGQCLRSAENDLTYGSPDLPREAHFRSQMLSGMLWDLQDSGDIPAADLQAIVFRALDFFLEDSGYHDLILSLMLADEDLFNGRYGCGIYTGAEDRGLSAFISDFSCKSSLPALAASSSRATDGSIGGGGNTTVRNSGSETKSGCAVIGQSLSNHLNSWLILLLPMALLWFRKKQTFNQ